MHLLGAKMIGSILLVICLVLIQISVGGTIERTEDERCPAQGHWLIPHEYDCTKFYYCEYGLRWVASRDCALGTEFSYALQVCTHPASANCNLPGVPPSSTTPPCSEVTTPGSPCLDVSTTTTTDSSPTPCPGGSTPGSPCVDESTTSAATETTTTTTTQPTTTTTTTTTSTTTPASTTTEEEPCDGPPAILDNGCPSNYSEHKLLPHETDCELFYYCVFGEKVLRQCGPGTHFNPVLQVCDWPANAGCESSPPCSEGSTPGSPCVDESTTSAATETTTTTTTQPTTTTTTTTTSTTTPASTTTEEEPCDGPPEILDNGCPSNYSEHKLLPHETDCELFYYCVFGEKVLRQCSPGTHFNPVLQVCDWPANAGCESSPPCSEGSTPGSPCVDDSTTTAATETTTTTTTQPTTTTTTTTTSTTTPASTTTEEEPCDGPPEILDNGCPSNYSEHKLLPHETDCELFYYCVFGEKVLRQCSPGTHFNPVLQVCDWPANAGCESSPPCSEGSTPGSPCVDESTTSAATETTTTTTTQPTTTTTTTTTSTTTPASTTTEEEPCDGPPEILDNGCPSNYSEPKLLPHEIDCELFYYCVFGEKELRQCPNDTHFNPVLQVCDWPANAGCESSPPCSEGSTPGSPCVDESTTSAATETTTTTTTQPTTTTTTTTTSTTTPASTTTEEEPCDGPPEILDNGCPSNYSEPKLLPHEIDCELFYYCVFGEKELRQCPNDTHFNPVLQVCDWPANAGCESSPPCSEGSTPGSPCVNESTTSAATETTTTTTTQPTTTTTTTTTSTTTPASTTTEEEPCDGPPEILDNGCPSNYSEPKLLPHEIDCELFYYCVFGEKELRQCPNDTHFNPVLQVCDWPPNAGCESSPPCSEGSTPGSPCVDESTTSAATETTTTTTTQPTTTTTTTTTSTTTPASTTTEEEPCDGPPEILDNGCPSNYSEPKLLPHEIDCELFYYCVFGEKELRQCPNDTHFNPVLQVCDWPANAGCESSPPCSEGSTPGSPCVNESTTSAATETTTTTTTQPKTTTTTTTTSTTTPASTTTEEEPCDGPPEILDNGCPSNYSEPKLLPHEIDCELFYYCVFGEKELRQCPNDTHFNPVLQVCDWPANAGCESSPPCSEGSTPGSPCLDDSTTSAATETTTTTTTQPTTTTTTTTTTSTTTPASTTTEEEPCEGPPEILDNGCPSNYSEPKLLPHEIDCELFYYCVFGEKELRQCPNDTHFNPVLQVCDWPVNAGCESSPPCSEGSTPGSPCPDGSTTTTTDVSPTPCPGGSTPGSPCLEDSTTTAATETTTTTTTTQPTTTTTSTTTSTTTPASTTTEEEPCDGPPEILDNGCPSNYSEHKLLSHEIDCELFYYCVFGEKVLRECSPGTHFNPVLQVCDWPWNAGCETSPPCSEGTTPGSPCPESSTASTTDSSPTPCPGGSTPGSPCLDDSTTTAATETTTTTTTAEPTTTTTTATSTTTPATTTTEVTTTETSTTETTTTESTTPAPTPPPLSPCIFNCNIPAWAHETECNKFYWCNGRNVVLGVCSEGLHFNSETSTCDFKDLAGCVA